MPRLALALLALALLAVAALAPAAPVPKEAKAADGYPTEVGTKWEYVLNGRAKQVCTEEVIKSDEKEGVRTVTVSVTEPGQKGGATTVRVEKGEVRLVGFSQGKFDPAPLIWKPGLKDGDTWTNKYSVQRREVEEEVSVGKAEEITTPAGKFTAVPITHKYTKPADFPVHVDWYTDGVGMVRRTTEGQKEPSQELKSFTPGKDKK